MAMSTPRTASAGNGATVAPSAPKLVGFGLGTVPHRKFVPRLQQMVRHMDAHVAESEKRNLHVGLSMN